MIPDFKTYLKESIWSDMQERGTGDIVKKEDDINNLSLEGLCSYLNENYTCRDNNCIFCQTMDDTLVLTVALYWSLGSTGYLFYTGEEIAIYKSSLDMLRCRGKLTHSYATSFDMDSTTISPKDKSIPVNNKFFIEVLDFFIDIVSKSGFEQQIKKKLSESVWSDMQDRGTGELQKKEDDVNLMSHKRFVEYLKNNYVEIEHRLSGWEIATYGSNQLATPIFGYPTGNGIRNQCAFLFLDCKEKVAYTNKCIIKYAPELLKKLNEKYDLWDDDPDYEDYIIINPTDTSKNPDHKYFLDLLNFILDNLDESTMHVITKKSMNESIWSDMQDRGSGKIEKKEDDINYLDPEGLCDYIKDNYQFLTPEQWPIYVFQKMRTSETTMHVLVYFESGRTLPNVPVYITFNPVDIIFSPANMPGRNVIKYFRDYKLLDALKSSFDLVEDDDDGRDYHINPKDGESADNKFILKVLDTFAENAKVPIIKKKEK